MQQFLVSQGITRRSALCRVPHQPVAVGRSVPLPAVWGRRDHRFPDPGQQVQLSASESDQTPVAQSPGRRLLHLGPGLYRATRQDFFNPQAVAVGASADPAADSELQRYLHRCRRPRSSRRYVNLVTKDWAARAGSRITRAALSSRLRTSTVNPNYQTSEDVRVPGQPLYTPGVNINNLSTYNPYYTQVLNPAAWAPVPLRNANGMAAGNLLQRFPRPPHSGRERQHRPQLPDQGKNEPPGPRRVRQHL